MQRKKLVTRGDAGVSLPNTRVFMTRWPWAPGRGSLVTLVPSPHGRADSRGQGSRGESSLISYYWIFVTLERATKTYYFFPLFDGSITTSNSPPLLNVLLSFFLFSSSQSYNSVSLRSALELPPLWWWKSIERRKIKSQQFLYQFNT